MHLWKSILKTRRYFSILKKQFVTNRNYDGIYVENGKWYCLNPESVATTSGDLSINYPKWAEGSIE